jgi:hypothetical protein
MMRTRNRLTNRRVRRLLVGLALITSMAAVGGRAPAAHAARSNLICLPSVCAIQLLPAISLSGTRVGVTYDFTLSGQGFTPGGTVRIFDQFIGPSGLTGVGLADVTTASEPFVICTVRSCRVITPGGAISVTGVCGAFESFIALDVSTGRWSNSAPC